MKPSNILLDGAGRARLADFGLARRSPSRDDAEGGGVLTGETGTYLYMAPEVMRHEDYGPEADGESWLKFGFCCLLLNISV